MPYKVKGKCIYKKDGGTKVGCTTGSVKKYLGALHANADESTTPKESIVETSKEIIKRLIRENVGSSELTEKYFKRRIPFLQEFKFFNNNDRIFAQKLSYHKNIKKMFDGQLITFSQFNVSSEFIYYTHTVNGNVFHNFILKNNFHPTQPINVDNLTFRIFILAIRQINEKLSYSQEIMVKEGHHINSTELDEIINRINEKMFKVEQVSNENNTALF